MVPLLRQLLAHVPDASKDVECKYARMKLRNAKFTYEIITEIIFYVDIRGLLSKYF